MDMHKALYSVEMYNYINQNVFNRKLFCSIKPLLKKYILKNCNNYILKEIAFVFGMWYPYIGQAITCQTQLKTVGNKVIVRFKSLSSILGLIFT